MYTARPKPLAAPARATTPAAAGRVAVGGLDVHGETEAAGGARAADAAGGSRVLGGARRGGEVDARVQRPPAVAEAAADPGALHRQRRTGPGGLGGRLLGGP